MTNMQSCLGFSVDGVILLAYWSPIYLCCPRMVLVFSSCYGIKVKGLFFGFQ